MSEDLQAQAQPASDSQMQSDDTVASSQTPEGSELYNAIRDAVKAEYEQKFLIWKSTELAELERSTDDKVHDLVSQFWEKWKEEQKPPTQEEIQTLLGQEYITFKIKVYLHETGEEREFTIRELPQSVERKFYRQFRKQLEDYGPQVAAFIQANMGKSFEEQVTSFLDAFDKAFDILADGVVLAIDPFGKEKLTREWVQNNISSNRQWNVVQAQIEVNRIRDFFSQLYRAGQKAEMMTQPVSFRTLLERAR